MRVLLEMHNEALKNLNETTLDWIAALAVVWQRGKLEEQMEAWWQEYKNSSEGMPRGPARVFLTTAIFEGWRSEETKKQEEELRRRP